MKIQQTINSEWPTLYNPFVRDLAWIFYTPALFTGSPFEFQRDMAPDWLVQLDRNPQPLMDYLNQQKSKLLGAYFEALWGFYLTHYPGKKLIARNLQVFDTSTSARRTVGEFDFIYYDQSSAQYRHLEVALKYYLGVPLKNADAKEQIASSLDAKPAYSPLAHWIGPGKSDRLDKKVSKMTQQQCRLADSIHAKPTLERLQIDSLVPEICLQGYLFYPNEATISPPYEINPLHCRGKWLTLSQLEAGSWRGDYWQILSKPFWLSSPLRQRNQLDTFERLLFSIDRQFNEVLFPQLIASFVALKGENGDQYVADELYFIVPEEWSGSARSIA